VGFRVATAAAPGVPCGRASHQAGKILNQQISQTCFIPRVDSRIYLIFVGSGILECV
jgi:hypothetical protein